MGLGWRETSGVRPAGSHWWPSAMVSLITDRRRSPCPALFCDLQADKPVRGRSREPRGGTGARSRRRAVPIATTVTVASVPIAAVAACHCELVRSRSPPGPRSTVGVGWSPVGAVKSPTGRFASGAPRSPPPPGRRAETMRTEDLALQCVGPILQVFHLLVRSGADESGPPAVASWGGSPSKKKSGRHWAAESYRSLRLPGRPSPSPAAVAPAR